MAALLLTAVSASAFETPGFQNPYGIAVDEKTSFIYVSNVNGSPTGRDDNGFISRLKADGSVDEMRFIDGGDKKITLHAPMGMAVHQKTLYVADVDALRAFDLEKGNHLFDVNFGELPVQHLYDVILAPDGMLYATDGPGNTIYRIDIKKQHEVTAFIQGEELGQPHGIAWYQPRQLFVVAGWSSGQVHAYDRAGKLQGLPSIFLRTLEGIAADMAGNLYVASTVMGAVYRIAPSFALFAYRSGLPAPAGVAFFQGGGQIIVASFDTGKVLSFPVEVIQP